MSNVDFPYTKPMSDDGDDEFSASAMLRSQTMENSFNNGVKSPVQGT